MRWDAADQNLIVHLEVCNSFNEVKACCARPINFTAVEQFEFVDKSVHAARQLHIARAIVTEDSEIQPMICFFRFILEGFVS